MGQEFSTPRHGFEATEVSLEEGAGPDSSTRKLELPLTTPDGRTVVHELGSVDKLTAWHVVGKRRAFPFPCGYRATYLASGGETCELSIHQGTGGRPAFVLAVDGERFSGSSPTAPFVLWALQRATLEIANGLVAFGFAAPEVQRALRQQAGPEAEFEDSVPGCGFARGEGGAAWPLGLCKGMDVDAEHGTFSPDARPSKCEPWYGVDQGRAPPEGMRCSERPFVSLRPHTSACASQFKPGAHPLHFGREGVAAQATPPLLPARQPLLQARSQEVTLTSSSGARQPLLQARSQEVTLASSSGARLPRLVAPKDGSGSESGAARAELGGPGTPPDASPAPSSLAQSDLDLAAAQAIHLSRARRSSLGSGSGTPGVRSGRGWTAFTAYGLEVRESVRADNPGSSSTEVEKLVGQRWAQLLPEEKKKYVELAAHVRKTLGSAGRGEERGGAGGGGGLARSRSEAAAVDGGRPQRLARPPSRYSEAPGGGGRGKGGRGAAAGEALPRDCGVWLGGASAGQAGLERARPGAAFPAVAKRARSLDFDRGAGSGAALLGGGAFFPRQASSEDYGVASPRPEAEAAAAAAQDGRQGTPMADAEEAVLGLLAEMRAEVMNSESSSGQDGFATDSDVEGGA